MQSVRASVLEPLLWRSTFTHNMHVHRFIRNKYLQACPSSLAFKADSKAFNAHTTHTHTQIL